MDKWRDSLRNGLMAKYNNIILTGGVDDIGRILTQRIVVDYKSQASRYMVETEAYLASPYHGGYKIKWTFMRFFLKKWVLK